MSFDYEEQASDSRFVDIIWRTHDTSDGTYLAAADACWDMIFIRSGTGARVLLSGPSSKITPVPYRAGNRNVGIRFHRGSFLTHVPTTAMVDTTEALPMPTRKSFVLAGVEWPMPTYETADDFVAELERTELLSDDPSSWPPCAARPAKTSKRSLQRHFPCHRAHLEPHPPDRPCPRRPPNARAGRVDPGRHPRAWLRRPGSSDARPEAPDRLHPGQTKERDEAI